MPLLLLRTRCAHLGSGVRFSKAPKTFWSRKAIYKNMINSFYKAVILTCLHGKKCLTNRGSLMLRKFFIYWIQSNLSCSKSTRKVSGLSGNAHLLVRDIRVSCLHRNFCVCGLTRNVYWFLMSVKMLGFVLH